MDHDASEQDKQTGRLSQTYARGFYLDIRNAVEKEQKIFKTNAESWVEKVGVKKSDQQEKPFVEMVAGKKDLSKGGESNEL